MKGFCAAQAVVVWLAIQGIGLADTVWSQFASNPLGSDGQVYTGVDMTANVRKLATSLLLANVCAESANQAIAKDRASGGMGARVFGSMTFGPTPFGAKNRRKVRRRPANRSRPRRSRLNSRASPR